MTSFRQKLLALNFIVLILHQFEEYAWPGGFPWICNEVLTPKPAGPPDRYPLNQNNAAFINVPAWVFYLVPVHSPMVGLDLWDPLSRLLRRCDHAALRHWWPARQSEFPLPICDGRNEPE